MPDKSGSNMPRFLEGSQVASYEPPVQPGFDDQLPLMQRDEELKSKLKISILVILSFFMGGMAIGAVAGIWL